MTDVSRLFRSIVVVGIAAGNAAAISCRPTDIAISDAPAEDAGCRYSPQSCDARAAPAYPDVDLDADAPDAADSGSLDADVDATDAADAPDV